MSRILVVDDDRATRQVLRSVLTKANFTVMTAKDGLAALEVMRHRRAWFSRMADPYLALWWVPAGTIPTVAEAKDRLELLASQGPSPAAFTFRAPFPEPADASR